MSEVKTALIAGGGIAGMTAAIALRKAGVHVDVVEKYGRNPAIGVGIILPGNALRALDQLGLAEATIRAGYPFGGSCLHDAQGNHPRDIPEYRMAGEKLPPQLGITRTAYSVLLTDAAEASGARISYHKHITGFEQDEHGAEAYFSDGSHGRYDLVVAADGIHSTLRPRLFGDLGAPVYSGQSSWRYNLPRPEYVDKIMMYLGEDGKTGFVPLRHDLMYLFLTDRQTHQAPTREDALNVLRARLAEFGGPVAYYRDTVINDPDQALWKPFETVDLPSPWYRGRTIVIGDAAHATTAHLGQGGAMAVEDAVVLGEEIAKPGALQAALERFMARRFPRVSFIQSASRQLCRWEIEHTAGADFVGLMGEANLKVREPI